MTERLAADFLTILMLSPWMLAYGTAIEAAYNYIRAEHIGGPLVDVPSISVSVNR